MNNKRDIFNTLVEKSKEIKLTSKERAKLFSAVDSYVQKNPILINKRPVASAPRVAPYKPIKSPFAGFGGMNIFHVYGARFAGAFMILAIFGVGTSFAAQNAIPGDILYPIKVNVNEGIKAALLSGVKRSEFEVVLVKTRVQEAKQLAAENRLSDKNQAVIASKIDSSVSRVKSDVANLTEKGDLKSALEISKKLVASLDDEDENESENEADEVKLATEQMDLVEDVIKEAKLASEKAQEETEEKIYTRDTTDENTLAIAEAKMTAVKKSLEVIEDEFEKMKANQVAIEAYATSTFSAKIADEIPTTTLMAKSKVSDTETLAKVISDPNPQDEIAELLAQVKTLLVEGQEKFDAGDYKEAFRLFRDAYEITQKIEAQFDLEENDIVSELNTIVNELESIVLEENADGSVIGYTPTSTEKSVSGSDEAGDKASVINSLY